MKTFSLIDHTILILSKDRHDLLHSACRYYTTYGFSVLVFDATEHLPPAYVRELSSPGFKYFHMPGTSIATRLTQAVSEINTQYLTWVTDDDFFFPDGILRCVRHLDNTSHIGSCGGQVRKLFRHRDTFCTYPWSHWTRVAFPESEPSINARLQRAARVLASVETASFFYLTYELTSFVTVVNYYSSLHAKTRVLDVLHHGSHELFVTMYNIVCGNTSIVAYPYAFRVDTRPVDMDEYIERIALNDDPKDQWSKAENSFVLLELHHYLDLAFRTVCHDSELTKKFASLLISCYQAQVALGDSWSPILTCLNPYQLDDSYFKPLPLSHLAKCYSHLSEAEYAELTLGLQKMDHVLRQSCTT